jgi:3'-phosphoadenosine 5'-phosphosulfate sulfotransferase (PAPS reductase)/FAD synthetase
MTTVSTRDPFRIDGPAIISFSGGRTSAYMLWRILQAYDGQLPEDVKVCFANTGKEMPETLNFVWECEERWKWPIHWLEYRSKNQFEEVTWGTASRQGEPFDALIADKSILPNPIMRFCTQELKIRTIQRFLASIGIMECTMVLGLRADERHRAAKALARAEVDSSKYAEVQLPLYHAGITKRDVQTFWQTQNFDLQLPNINGINPRGNCDLCFLKSTATLSSIIQDMPDLAQWWIAKEVTAQTRRQNVVGYMGNKDIVRFRKDRPSYAEMLDAVERQGVLDFGDLDSRIDCFCSEDAS